VGCTACTEPQCLYKGALYLYIYLYTNTFLTPITSEVMGEINPWSFILPGNILWYQTGRKLSGPQEGFWVYTRKNMLKSCWVPTHVSLVPCQWGQVKFEHWEKSSPWKLWTACWTNRSLERV